MFIVRAYFQEGRGPESPFELLWFLQPPCPGVLHEVPPPFVTVFVARLQALKMACSWFSSTRKSCGGLYGFFLVMMYSCLLVPLTQGMNQHLLQRRLCERKRDVASIGDWGFSGATFPSCIRRLLIAKCMDFAGAAE
jgi:hypothetical protein